MSEALHVAQTIAADIGSFFIWLGIHPSLQDLVKALFLTVFVLAILMVVGDVYRGEIQNELHRIILAPSTKGIALAAEQRTAFEARRRLRKEKDTTCHVPQFLVPLTLKDVHSNVFFYFRYRDCGGRLKSQLVETYRSRFHVRKNAHPHSLRIGHEADHRYTTDEEDRLSEEEAVTIITMAASRVDYIQVGRIEPLLEKETAKFDSLKGNALAQALAGIKQGQLKPPEPLGLAIKFHFPINPYFLLYRHPDTNVRTTAWLTVLTSVFALFMQLIYSGGSGPGAARPDVAPPAITRSAAAN
jgi:hypothetical protein